MCAIKLLKRLPFFLLLVASFAANAVEPVNTADLPKIKYEKYALKNGLEVILVEDRSLPLAAVNIWYHVGAADEEPGHTGFAHLFEHMIFAGTRHIPRGVAERLLEAAGGSDSNASTSFDRTNYFDVVPSSQLELALWIHADRMGYLLDVLDQRALINQQDVVRNERRQTTENRPYGIVEEALWHNLFPKSHPYHAFIMGSHADIQAATLEDIKKFFKLNYRPNNATLTIVGDINKGKTKQLVEKYFGSFRRGPDRKPRPANTPVINEERRAVIQDRVELQSVIMGWHTPRIFTPGDAELSLAGQILGGGKTSRLYRSLVYEKQIAQDVSAYQYSLRLGSVFVVDVTARPGHTAQEIESAIDEELDKLRASTVDAKELERARNTIETSMISGLETFSTVADMLNRYNHYTSDPGYFAKEIAAYRQVTREQIQRLVNEQLKNTARVVIHGMPGQQDLGPEVPTPPPSTAAPGTGTESLNAAQPWRKNVPRAAKQRLPVLPKGDEFKLANGLTVIHHHKPGLPLVSAYLVVKAGSEANPPDKPGLASSTAALLDEGTATLSSKQIADEIAQLGASLSASASADATAVQLFSLKRNFAKAADIMADIILNPTFPTEEIERHRASRLGELAQIREDASAVAGTVSAAALYGFSHPYGYPALGTEIAIRATARDDLVAFWTKHYVPDNAALVVSGDITRSEVKALAESRFGQWQPGKPETRKPNKPDTTAARLMIVDKPGAPQTALRLATIGPDRKTPDFAALEVLNAALGGLFTSRINTNLRAEKGYTYGAHSQFHYRRMPGSFEVRAGVRTDVTAAAVKEILAEIRGLKTKPIMGAELQKARDSLLLSLPSAFETGSSIASSLADTYVYGLGVGYYNRLADALRHVDAKAVAVAVEKYLKLESLIVVGVGDRAKIEPELAKLKLGPIEYRNVDGKLIER